MTHQSTLALQIQSHIEANRPKFIDNRLLDSSSLDLLADFESVAYSNDASVDLSHVVGMYHPNYVGCTWAELIGTPVGENYKLARLNSCLRELNVNPTYYEEKSIKANWSFSLIDGELYCDEGHHRTVIGRCYLQTFGKPTRIHGVALNVYRRIHKPVEFPNSNNSLLSKLQKIIEFSRSNFFSHL
jgi:hypothetical protein